MFGRAQQRGGIDRLGGCQAQLMRKQRRVGCDLVEARDGAQGDKGRIRNAPCFRGPLRWRANFPVLLHGHLPHTHLESLECSSETSRYFGKMDNP
ncbi:hypothetical protein FQZ97_1254070 [compost metagenome]